MSSYIASLGLTLTLGQPLPCEHGHEWCAARSTHGNWGGARMDWSISDIARLAGTTSRTLRHYDHIGLLAPSRIGANGYRHYDEAALRRLQRILLLRELGLGLDAIAEALVHNDDVSALTTHVRWLREEQARIGRQIASVELTIDHREGRGGLMAHDMFDGFNHNDHREEVERRWGHPRGMQARGGGAPGPRRRRMTLRRSRESSSIRGLRPRGRAKPPMVLSRKNLHGVSTTGSEASRVLHKRLRAAPAASTTRAWEQCTSLTSGSRPTTVAARAQHLCATQCATGLTATFSYRALQLRLLERARCRPRRRGRHPARQKQRVPATTAE